MHNNDNKPAKSQNMANIQPDPRYNDNERVNMHNNDNNNIHGAHNDRPNEPQHVYAGAARQDVFNDELTSNADTSSHEAKSASVTNHEAILEEMKSFRTAFELQIEKHQKFMLDTVAADLSTPADILRAAARVRMASVQQSSLHSAFEQYKHKLTDMISVYLSAIHSAQDSLTNMRVANPSKRVEPLAADEWLLTQKEQLRAEGSSLTRQNVELETRNQNLIKMRGDLKQQVQDLAQSTVAPSQLAPANAMLSQSLSNGSKPSKKKQKTQEVTFEDVLQVLSVYDEDAPEKRKPASQMSPELLSILRPSLESFCESAKFASLNTDVRRVPKCAQYRATTKTICEKLEGLVACTYCVKHGIACIIVEQGHRPTIVPRPLSVHGGVAPNTPAHWLAPMQEQDVTK